MKRYFLGVFLSVQITCLLAQCPNPSFSYDPGSYCLNENIQLINTTTNGVLYEWDFCSGDNLEMVPEVEIVESNLGLLYNTFTVFSESNHYTFLFNTSLSNSFDRISFGSSLVGAFAIDRIETAGASLTSPINGVIYEESSNWYGLVLGFSNSSLYRLSFGNSLLNSPTVENITGSIGFNSPIGMSLEESDNLYLFVTNNSGGNTPIIRLNFGNSILNTPVVTEIPTTNTNQLANIDIVKDCDNWYGFVASRANGRIYRLVFGNDLDNDPVIDEIGITSGLTFDNPLGIKVVEDGVDKYLFVTSRNGPLYRLDFGDTYLGTPIGSNLGNLNGEIRDWGLELIKKKSQWVGIQSNFGGSLSRYIFGDTCSATLSASTLFEPVGLEYSEAGLKEISLSSTNNIGNTQTVVGQLTVLTDVAPNSVFSTELIKCISVANTFTPSTPGLTTYSWDFDGDNIEDSNLENPLPYNYPAPGTYTARLDVNDGTCDNFTEQEITIYPVPPNPTFTAVSTECTNTPISFTNTTDESQHMGVLAYSWDFNGEGSSMDKDPTFSFTTPGTKDIVLTASIPGCDNMSSIFQIDIAPGPTSNFTASAFSICEGELITFTDTSMPDGSPIDSWDWDFDNGMTSTAQNPSPVFFTTAGNYFVSLTTTDSSPDNCGNTVTQEVVVSPVPVVAFDFDVPCTSPDGIQFTDLSTVSGADIVERRWFIDNVQVSTDQNPQLVFASTGTVNVRLETTSSNGCEDSYNEDILILATPTPAFSSTMGCQGTASMFEDQTSSVGNPIVSWLWTVDGTMYNTQNISHVFISPGNFDVTLEVTAQNFCSSTITQSVEIQQLPTASFTMEGECSNELIRLTDTSVEFQDPITSREWFLDGTSVGNGTENFLSSLANGSYNVTLQLTTAAGCITSTSQTLTINDAPEAAFSASRTYGIPGDEITFINNSSGASSTHWLLNGATISTDMPQERIRFSDPGNQQVSIVANNELGCSDTLTSEILIAIPEVDLSIGQFDLVEEGPTGSIFLEIRNNSNLPIEVTNAIIELENQFSVSEQILSPIGIGESQLVSLNVGIPIGVTELSYLCVTLQSEYTDYPDLTPVDNEKCVTIRPNIIVEAPFPNPTRSTSRIKVVVTESTTARITILDSSGKIESISNESVEAGLNNFFIDLSLLRTGSYFIKVEVGGMSSIQRIIKF